MDVGLRRVDGHDVLGVAGLGFSGLVSARLARTGVVSSLDGVMYANGLAVVPGCLEAASLRAIQQYYGEERGK